MMLMKLIVTNLVHILATVLNLSFYVLSAGLDQPFPEKNTPNERSSNANTILQNLSGLSEYGIVIEDKLRTHVRQGNVLPSKVGDTRVRMLWHEKGRAEHQRNTRHRNGLNFKNEIREASQSKEGRKRLRDQDVHQLALENSQEKKKFRNTMHLITSDTNVYRQNGMIGHKDANYINKPKWKDSRKLGYQTDSGSKGSSFGYKSSSQSSSENLRPKRYNTPPARSSSSTSSDHVSGSTSSKHMESSTATSKYRPH